MTKQSSFPSKVLLHLLLFLVLLIETIILSDPKVKHPFSDHFYHLFTEFINNFPFVVILNYHLRPDKVFPDEVNKDWDQTLFGEGIIGVFDVLLELVASDACDHDAGLHP